MRRILVVFGIGIIVAAANAAPAQADAVGNQLSIQRNELRTEYRKASKARAEVEESIDDSTDTTTMAGNATTIWAVRNARNDRLQQLRARLKDLKDRQSSILRDYKQLTRKAERHFGELPMWWEADLD
jgi:hypothetical protein